MRNDKRLAMVILRAGNHYPFMSGVGQRIYDSEQGRFMVLITLELVIRTEISELQYLGQR